MDDYEDSIRHSLSNVDDEEILENLKKGSYTNEAKKIAESILSERGYKVVAGNFVNENLEGEKFLKVIEPARRNWVVGLVVFSLLGILYAVLKTVGRGVIYWVDGVSS